LDLFILKSGNPKNCCCF